MSIFKYILKSLIHFKKQHLSVFAGTLISTAVLTGALIVGDSIKFSLKQIVDTRLGNTRFALQTGERFVRNALADEISDDLGIKASALLQTKGIAINSELGLRNNKTDIYGIDKSFWELSNINIQGLNNNEVYISKNLAQRLNLKVNDEILLRIEKSSVIPLNTPFNKEETPSSSFRVVVKNIIDDSQLGRFGLKNIQTAPFNIFINGKYLTDKLELEGLANIILISDESKNISLTELNSSFKKIFKIADANLVIRELESHFEILSDRIFIDEALSNSINSLDIPNNTILTYLVNTLSYNQKETPYSFVTAASNELLPQSLNKNEIIINDWLQKDLGITIGDSLELEYFVIGPLKTLEEKKSKFIIKDIIPVQGEFSNNTLMPLFPGLADAGSCSEWEAGIPIDLDRIRDKDEVYWDDYKGTPKAFISIEKGIELWSNKYGNYTSLRFNKESIDKNSLENEILEKISPTDIKLNFISVRDEGHRAASNGVDFGELFLSLSFFVIASGVLLTLLLYSLNIESRSTETGVLSGLGFKRNQIFKLRFFENAISIVIGGILGAVVGILYNQAIMFALNSVWHDIVRTNMLHVYILPKTLIIGAISGILIAFITIYFVTRKKLKYPIIGLIRKSSSINYDSNKNRTKLYRIISGFCFLLIIFIVSYSLYTSVDQNAGLFLSAGGIFIVASTLLFAATLNKTSSGKKAFALKQLAFINASRNKGRSIAIIALLALGTFTVIITGANRKTFYGTENNRNSGTGGYLYWAETTLPILYNLNTEYGKEKIGLDDDVLNHASFFQMHLLDGDDASCLNLNQIQKPQILGINEEELNNRGSFSFAKLLDQLDSENPWLELNKTYGNNIIPAYADQTVITWGLIKEVGDTLIYLNEKGEELKIVLIGGLNASIFQGNLLISDKHFNKHFPSVSGANIMLIDSKTENQSEIADLLNSLLRNFGINLTSTSERLSQFYSVTNTYLTVFMILGGLGIIIGTLGLGIVLTRNIIERRNEIALLSAIGYKRKRIFKLILMENIYLLVFGISIGIFSALIGILPSLLSSSFNIPGFFIIVIVLIVIANGLIWIYIPARNALKSNLVISLRNE